MRAACCTSADRQAGFTLIETLAALVLMGLLMSALAAMTSQWLPSWNRGFDRIQRSESVGTALDRISADIGASEYMRPNPQAKTVLFDGSESSMTFVRTSFGPNAGHGLEIVRIAEAAGRDGTVLTRSRAALTPGAEAAPAFTDPVVLLRAPYQLTFSYADGDRSWKKSWRGSETLPAAVLLSVRDASTGRNLPISRIAAIHISAPADSVCAKAAGGCDGKAAAPRIRAARKTFNEAER